MVRRRSPARDIRHTAAMPGRWVLIGVSVLGLAIAGCGPGPSPIPSFSPPPGPVPVPSGAVEPWTDLVWKAAVVPDGPFEGDDERFTGVAAGPAGFVAIGYRERGPDRHGIVRRSATGGAWEAVDVGGLFDFVEPLDIEAGPDGFVVLGVRSGGPVGDHSQTMIFRSTDGEDWVGVPPLPGALDTFPYWMAAGDAGVIASAYGSEGAPLVWVADDGLSFERADPRGDGILGVVDPEAVPGGFTALGLDGGAPRFQRSRDGIEWTWSVIDAGSDLVATDLVVGRSGYVVQGIHAPGCGPFASCPGTPVAWWSADGNVWGRVPDDGSPAANGGSVVASAGDHGFIAIDGSSAWWSPDGWHWRPLPEPGDGQIAVTDAAVRGEVIVAVGEEAFEDGSVVGRILVGG